MRGYCGLAFYQPKDTGNLGVALRSVHCFGGDFISLIGARYGRRQASDTTDAGRHIPIFEFPDIDGFLGAVPQRATVVSIEVDGDRDLGSFVHPQSAVYLLGGEDRTLPAVDGPRVRIATSLCLNLAMAATIVLYDRSRKMQRAQRVMAAQSNIQFASGVVSPR